MQIVCDIVGFDVHIVYDVVYDVVYDAALIPLGGRGGGGAEWSALHLQIRVHWQIRFFTLPVLLQQPDSMATPGPPTPPRPASLSPFSPLSGLPRHFFRFARPQPGAAC